MKLGHKNPSYGLLRENFGLLGEDAQICFFRCTLSCPWHLPSANLCFFFLLDCFSSPSVVPFALGLFACFAVLAPSLLPASFLAFISALSRPCPRRASPCPRHGLPRTSLGIIPGCTGWRPARAMDPLDTGGDGIPTSGIPISPRTVPGAGGASPRPSICQFVGLGWTGSA